MQNINYFCIVKRFKSILRLPILVLLLFASGSIYSYAITSSVDSINLAHADSAIHIGLLTCQPGQEVYSLYGHTAIHYIHADKHMDVAINYGTFDFNQPNFVANFVLGRTDYMMSVIPFGLFCAEYHYEKRGVVEQVLDIPPADKLRFAKAIEENSRPENLQYRYNFFYDNCTTRARDIALGRLGKQTDYHRADDGPSFREMIHQYTAERPWARMGNDLLLGLQADRPTTIGEQQFLPYNLMDDFDKATIGPDNHKLVKQTSIIISPFANVVEKEFPLSPTACAIIVAIIIIALTCLEHVRRTTFWGFDLLLLAIIGLCGVILAIMLFSQHPTVRINLQILLLNPMAIVCLLPVVKREKKGRGHWFWGFYFVCIILFLIGNFVQCYAEGMNILALSLLFRSGMRIWTSNKTSKNIHSTKPA